jgi:glycosyltransferase involved in cell wall biosynthesis
VFDHVVVIARTEVLDSEDRILSLGQADGPFVQFHALPNFFGPWEYLRTIPRLRSLIRTAVAACDAYILRVPGAVSRIAYQEIRRMCRPYALEVLGDPRDSLGPGAWSNPFRSVFRAAACHELKALCREAVAINYVTEVALQERYPAGRGSYSAGVTDAMVEAAFASEENLGNRIHRIERSPWVTGSLPLRIGFVGSLARLYKGPDVLLRAVGLLRAKGLRVELSIVGSGRHVADIKRLAVQLRLTGSLQLLGELAFGHQVYEFLDSIDLFIMPSRAEGLPRALVEAMARGCPCIASDVGGIPELLATADLVCPGDPACLADAILRASQDRDRLKRMAFRNFETANRFRPEFLNPKRREFLREVRLRM